MHLESTDGIVKRDTSFNISVNGQSRGVAHGVAERDISENRSVDSDDPIKRIFEVYVADATFYHQVPEHGTGNRNIPHKSLSVYVERRALIGNREPTIFIARRGPVYTKQKPGPHFYQEPLDSSHPLPATGGRSPSSRFAKHDQLQTTTYNPSTVPANTRAFHRAWIATGTSKLPDARYR